jgi:hypothetical protein
MKKFLLLLVAAVLAGGLVLSCSQPSSFEVTLTPGSAESVSTEAIKYDVAPGYNLVRWDGANDGYSYYVYRKTVDADNNPVDASILSLGNGSQTDNLKLWYYQDSAVKNGEKYQYGIVTVGYKDAANGGVVVKSEIAWQAETDTNKYAAANVPATGTKYQLPATLPEVKITAVNANNPNDTTQYDAAEELVLEISKLDLNYNYGLVINYSTTSGNAETTYTQIQSVVNNIWAANSTSKISNYLENGTTIIIKTSNYYNDGGSLTKYDNTAARLVTTITTADSNGFLEITAAGTGQVLDSNQKVLATVPKK